MSFSFVFGTSFLSSGHQLEGHQSNALLPLRVYQLSSGGCLAKRKASMVDAQHRVMLLKRQLAVALHTRPR